MNGLKVAVGQLSIEDGCREKNEAAVVALIDDVGSSHDLVVLPETVTSGFSRYDEVAAIAEPLDGPLVSKLEALAARHDCTIVVGVAERDGDQLFNTAITVGPAGLLMSYRKTHLWSADGAIFKAGNSLKRIALARYALGTLICYDVEFPEPVRALSAMGTDVVALCNGNMHPYGDVHRRAIVARAQENQIFVAMANRVGRGRDDAFAGGSMIVGPDGGILAELGEEASVASVEIDLDQIKFHRQRYFYLADRRIVSEQGAVRMSGNIAELDLYASRYTERDVVGEVHDRRQGNCFGTPFPS